jgi:alkylation response protein AidB-like acyl-CoA dehydrogenase
MDMLPTDEQAEIMTSVSSFLSTQLPIAKLRSSLSEESSIDRSVWAKCAELGWFGLGLDEASGGVGYGLAEEALLFREIGRHLAAGPFVSTVLAARVAAAAGLTEVTQGLLDGSKVAGLALPVNDAIVGATLSGTFDLYDTVGADLVLVVDPQGASLVEADALGPRRTEECIDPAVKLSQVSLQGLATLAYVPESQEPAYQRGTVLTAAALTGLSEHARDMAAEHARTRIQFGKPIGVHQAIKHVCTEMAVRSEAAGCQLFFAAMSVDGGHADAAFQAESAKLVAIDAAHKNSRHNVQVHGGMGYTWEHDAHLLVKRAHIFSRMFGDRKYHAEQLIALGPVQ